VNEPRFHHVSHERVITLFKTDHWNSCVCIGNGNVQCGMCLGWLCSSDEMRWNEITKPCFLNDKNTDVGWLTIMPLSETFPLSNQPTNNLPFTYLYTLEQELKVGWLKLEVHSRHVISYGEKPVKIGKAIPFQHLLLTHLISSSNSAILSHFPPCPSFFATIRPY